MKLKLSSKVVDDILGDITIQSNYDKTFKILQSWENKKGNSADIDDVIKVLQIMNKNLIADALIQN